VEGNRMEENLRRRWRRATNRPWRRQRTQTVKTWRGDANLDGDAVEDDVVVEDDDNIQEDDDKLKQWTQIANPKSEFKNPILNTSSNHEI